MKYKVKKPIVLDVSRWQGPIDWTQVAPQPVLVLSRATEGTGYNDPQFQANWNGLKTGNIRRGAYHYFHPEMDASQQFANYQNAIIQGGGFLPGDLAPILDVEGLDTAPTDIRKSASTAIKLWLDSAEAYSGRTPMIYTSKYQWGLVTDVNGKTPDWTGNYPLWVAWIPDKPDKTAAPVKGAIPAGWSQWAIWQYGNDGQITGVNALVDLNIMSDWYAKQVNQQNPIPVPQVVVGKVISPTGVNVRAQPNVNAKIIGGVVAGTTVKGASIKVVSPEEAWLELRDPIVGWCAIVYNGTVLISVNTG